MRKPHTALLKRAQLALAAYFLKSILRRTPQVREVTPARLEVRGPAVGSEDTYRLGGLAVRKREARAGKQYRGGCIPRGACGLVGEPRAQVGKVVPEAEPAEAGHL